MIKSNQKPKNTKLKTSKSKKKKRRSASQIILERMKELELVFNLSPKITRSQTNLFVQKFLEIIKDSSISAYQKSAVKQGEFYYLIEKEIK